MELLWVLLLAAALALGPSTAHKAHKLAHSQAAVCSPQDDCWAGLSHVERLTLQKQLEAQDVVLLRRDGAAFEIEFRRTGPLGLQFAADRSIMGFVSAERGRMGAAERCGLLRVGDLLEAVDGDSVADLTASDTFQVLDEAGQRSAATGAARRFVFSRADEELEGKGSAAEGACYSEETALAQEGGLEHMDVFDYEGKETPVHIMMALDVGTPATSCAKRRLVFVEPWSACADGDAASRLPVDVKELSGAFAVVRRGECPFHQKAQLLQHLNVSGVVVINSEDRLFRMQRDPLWENDVTVPMALMSVVDGDLLHRKQVRHAKDMHRFLEARIVASQDCLAWEAKDMERRRGGSRGSGGSGDQRARGDVQAGQAPDSIGVPHFLYGALAPSGRLHVAEAKQSFPRPHEDAASARFDFVKAGFGGPLPLGELLYVQQSASANGGVLLVGHPGGESGDDALVQDVLRRQPSRRSQRGRQDRTPLALVVVASPNASIWRIHTDDVLPSPVQTPVIMVSQRAGQALSAMGARLGVQLEPLHNVKRRWDEVAALRQESWPTDPRMRRRMVARLSKSTSACLQAHIQSTVL